MIAADMMIRMWNSELDCVRENYRAKAAEAERLHKLKYPFYRSPQVPLS